MKRLHRSRCAFCIAAALVLSGCGGLQAPVTPAPVTAATRTTHIGPAISYQTLHSFLGSNGAEPDAGLIDVNGTLYGTTDFGGTHNVGTVFSITTAGRETLVHSFLGQRDGDGAYPQADLHYANGKLYGTTWLGGDHNRGTVYSIGEFGAETVLHSFRGVDFGDGSNPIASLRYVNGMLYGTTLDGGVRYGSRGARTGGTVYSITPTGTETVLYAFGGGSDGAKPAAGLCDVSGTFYGTTLFGGEFDRGTAYSITASGTERVLHSFGFPDGSGPNADLRDVDGTLYGTTLHGGVYGEGTVYSITTTGSETVLHNFGSGSDGAKPAAGLRNVNGTLYGTTSEGGAYGGGTVYSITTTGSEMVLHNFGSGSDGKTPKANLLAVNGTLYGTTELGGAHGRGTVFSLIP